MPELEDVLQLLRDLQAADTSLGAYPGPALATPHPAAWGRGPTWQFRPDAQLDPSQVNWWVGNRNPWRGFTGGPTVWPGITFDPPPVFFDPVGSTDAPGYPWGRTWDRLASPLEGP